MSPSLQAQAAAVARTATNLRGHVQNLRTYVAQKKRGQLELDIAAGWLPDLEAAAKTMAELAAEQSRTESAA